MDTEPTEEPPQEIQASLMGALLRTRGVPGGLQGVAPAIDQPSPDIETEIVNPEPGSDAASLLGISPETLAAVAEPVEVPVAVEAPEAENIIASPTVVEAEPDNLDDPKPDGVGRVILEWVVVLVGAVVMALVLRHFIFQAFWIPSESMETTLEIRDRVLVNRLSYQWGDVGRGDIVVFARKPEETGEIRDLIKRVIGLPGDTVEGRDNAIYIDGARLDEPYVAPENMIFSDFGPVVVPEDELFVMGDNRDQSFDSRLFGTVSEDRVAGRAFVLFWPLDRAGAL